MIGSNVYILSNNHVLANQNDASFGDPTLQPGAFDSGTEPGDVIGTLYDFEPINFKRGTNSMDAAITIVDADAVSGSTPDLDDGGYGPPGTSPVGVVQGAAGPEVRAHDRAHGWCYR